MGRVGGIPGEAPPLFSTRRHFFCADFLTPVGAITGDLALPHFLVAKNHASADNPVAQVFKKVSCRSIAPRYPVREGEFCPALDRKADAFVRPRRVRGNLQSNNV